MLKHLIYGLSEQSETSFVLLETNQSDAALKSKSYTMIYSFAAGKDKVSYIRLVSSKQGFELLCFQYVKL